MKLTDLKTGMLVVHQNGEIGKVLLNTKDGDFLFRSNGMRCRINDLNLNLNKQLDVLNPIVSIYEPKSPMYTISYELNEYNKIWEKNKTKYVIANHFGSNLDYTWILPEGIDVNIGDIVEVDTSRGNQLVQIKKITDYTNLNITRKVIRKVVI